MPLDDGYGVLVGTLVAHERDRPDNQGRWYHVMLTIDVAGARYKAAVDVDSHQSATGVQWKVVPATASDLGPPATLPIGWHPLASTPTSGGLDHIRHPIARTWRFIRPALTQRRVLGWTPWWRWVSVIYRPWRTGDNLQASEALEQILTIGGTILVWGEPFDTGRAQRPPEPGRSAGLPVGGEQRHLAGRRRRRPPRRRLLRRLPAPVQQPGERHRRSGPPPRRLNRAMRRPLSAEPEVSSACVEIG